MSEKEKTVTRLSLEDVKTVIRGILAGIEDKTITKNPLMENLNKVEEEVQDMREEIPLPMFVIFPDGGKMEYKFMSSACRGRDETEEDIRMSIELKNPTPK